MRQPGGDVERTDAQLEDMGWVEWGGELIWAVGFTSGGAPFGLRASELDPAELEAMGPDPELARAAGSASAEPWLDGSDAPF